MMKLSVGWNVAIQMGLIALVVLVPAFVPLTSSQQAAISTFVGLAQGLLGLKAYYLTPQGDVANSMPPPQPPPANPNK